MEELELIINAQKGDAESRDILLNENRILVKLIARTFLLSDFDKDDLVSEGMIALNRAIDTFDSSKEASFRTYATRCIKNKMLDIIRKWKNQIPPVNIEEIPESAHPSTDPIADLINDDALKAFASYLFSVLNDTEKKVLALYIEAHSYEEIAAKLNIDKKKVDNAIYSARKKVKQLLNIDNK